MKNFNWIWDVFAAIGFAVTVMFVCAVIMKVLFLLYRA